MYISISQRFTQAYDFLKRYGKLKDQSQLVEILDVSKGYVSQIVNGKKEPSSLIVNRFVNYFPEISRTWLETGEGDMLISTNDNMENITIARTDEDGPVRCYIPGQGVPYYNVDFLGGYDVIENDQTILPLYNIDFKQYNEATCWCDVSGHSMEPEISAGDIVALKKIEDFSFLPYGEIYAIVTRNGMRTIKRLGPASTPDKYMLIPTNKSEEYGNQELPISMIAQVFAVLGCMKKL